jgi:hypothetical protein
MSALHPIADLPPRLWKSLPLAQVSKTQMRGRSGLSTAPPLSAQSLNAPRL